MTRLANTMDRLSRRRGLISYIVAGHPHPDVTVPAMHALVEAGSDVIELGMPFSDPMAEGKIICRAHACALQHGVGLDDVFNMVESFRATDSHTPIVLMGYTNPVEQFGVQSFIDAMHNAGVDGLLLVDMPYDEAESIHMQIQNYQMSMIFLITPTTDSERVCAINKMASGFIYCVSLTGITGADHVNSEEVIDRLAHLRPLVHHPLAVGFGIKDIHTATQIATKADAIVLGSILSETMESEDDVPAAIHTLLTPYRKALDQIREDPL